MGSRYLQYWWKRSSKIDPNEFSGRYYRVFYDLWRRYVVIEAYNEEHRLTDIYKYAWKRGRVARIEAYLPDGKLQNYTVYHRRWYGALLKMERYYPDGAMIPLKMD
jgi:hypothetical protein